MSFPAAVVQLGGLCGMRLKAKHIMDGVHSRKPGVSARVRGDAQCVVTPGTLLAMGS